MYPPGILDAKSRSMENRTANAFVAACHPHSKNGTETPPYRHLSVPGQIVVTTLYLTGVIGTLVALYIIHKKNKYKNKKHLFLLKCLMGVDFVSLMGMLVQMHIQLYSGAEVREGYMMCLFRVLWRWFGLASACVSIVMAIERWIALTHPFFYQKNVTHKCIMHGIIWLWIIALGLTCMPLIGFGLYYENSCCKRYRLATKPVDVFYAYLMFGFCLCLCIGISCANLSVSRSLCHAGRNHQKMVGRRNRSLKRHNSSFRGEGITSTPDEVAFARLMVALSAAFLFCWLPQLMTIPLAQFAVLRKEHFFFRIADILMAIHYVSDPYIYVLLHYEFPCIKMIFELIQRHCCSSGSEISKSDDDRSEKSIVHL